MKILTKDALSLKLINQSAMSERVTKEHPGNMHLWWNRSPIESSKKLIETLIANHKNISTCVTVVDPLSGFGGLTLAAEKLGLPIVAGDLNSVAVVLTKAAVEIPSRFANRSAVSADAGNKVLRKIFCAMEML